MTIEVGWVLLLVVLVMGSVGAAAYVAGFRDAVETIVRAVVRLAREEDPADGPHF